MDKVVDALERREVLRAKLWPLVGMVVYVGHMSCSISECTIQALGASKWRFYCVFTETAIAGGVLNRRMVLQKECEDPDDCPSAASVLRLIVKTALEESVKIDAKRENARSQIWA